MLRNKLLQKACVSWNLLRHFEEGRQCCDAFTWALLPWKRNNFFPLHSWRTRFVVNNVVNIECIVMEAQQCGPSVVALHMSLVVVRYVPRSSCKAPNIFVLFLTKFVKCRQFEECKQFFVKVHHMKRHGNPLDWNRADKSGQTRRS